MLASVKPLAVEACVNILGRSGPAIYASIAGGLSVGTPGVVSYWPWRTPTHGKLTWAALCPPAIDLAGNGFPYSPRLYTTRGALAKRMCNQKTVAAHYLKPECKPKGRRLAAEEPERAVAKDGPKAFYSGPIAEAIVER